MIALLLLLPLALRAESLDPAAVRLESSEEQLMADLALLSGADSYPGENGEQWIRSRYIRHPDIELARDWLIEQFVDLGLDVREESFSASGIDGLSNIIAELPGLGETPEIVILGAHYDSTASKDEDWSWETDPAPGADDDGSGIVALLEAARLLSAYEGGFEHTIRFEAFSAEEQGLLGSAESAAIAAKNGDRIRLMIEMDPVGSNPGEDDTLWVVHREAELPHVQALGPLVTQIGSPIELYTIDDAIIDDAFSDHFPYWQAGFPAVHVGVFPMPPTYHTMDDDLSVIDPVFLRESCALMAAWTATLASPIPFDPQEVEAQSCGCSLVSDGTSAPAFTLILPLALLCLGRARRSNRTVGRAFPLKMLFNRRLS